MQDRTPEGPPQTEAGSLFAKVLSKWLRKPIARRPRGRSTRLKLEEALSRIDSIALASASLPDLAEKLSGVRSKKREKVDPERDRAMIELAAALYASRKWSYAEFAAQANFWALHLRDQRESAGHYDSELEPIQKEMDAIHAASVGDLSRPLFLKDAPPEYRRLNDRYNEVLEGHVAQILRDFGQAELAEFLESEPVKFRKLCERGWRVIDARQQKDLAPSVRDIVVSCEADALAAARSGAYFAAVTMLGSAIEGQLLLRCLRSPRKAARIARGLKGRRPDCPGKPVKWTFEQLTLVCSAAGWLPQVETEVAIYDSASIVDELRSKRNLIHPGRQASKRPWAGVSEHDYKDALALYSILCSRLSQPRVRSEASQ